MRTTHETEHTGGMSEQRVEKGMVTSGMSGGVGTPTRPLNDDGGNPGGSNSRRLNTCGRSNLDRLL